MDFEKYTERSRGFIQSAQTLALREGHQKFTPEHVLKVLLDDEEGLAAGLIKAAGGDSRLALRDTEAALAKMPKVSGSGAGQVYPPEMARVFEPQRNWRPNRRTVCNSGTAVAGSGHRDQRPQDPKTTGHGAKVESGH
jgi:ATP-dependent Clp protease ATP-binding subunit ClpA